MEPHATRLDKLVMTQAEPAPPPQRTDTQPTRGNAPIDPETLAELKRLAERIGGLERLKEVIDLLVKVPR